MAERTAFANLGAEEGVRALKFREGKEGSPLARLAQHFEELVQQPPWPALAAVEGMVAWMNTDDAVAAAAQRSLPLWGAPVDVVRRVHDKGFAMGVAVQLGLLDDDLAATVSVLEAAQLEPDIVAAAIARWPPWARAEATLKPRWGTSGRGRVAVRGGVIDERVRNSLAGLRARGGAVLEPWLSRTSDLSSQWLVAADGEPCLLGCTRMITRPSGVWLGCEMVRDDAGQGSGTPWDRAIVAAARPLVAAAARAGFVGVCGVDAFTWQRDGVERLRGIVELNARFTGGAVALAANHGLWGCSTFRIQD